MTAQHAFGFSKWMGFASLTCFLLSGIERWFGVFSGLTLLVGEWSAMLMALSLIFAGACLLEYARVEMLRQAEVQPADKPSTTTLSSTTPTFDRSALD